MTENVKHEATGRYGSFYYEVGGKRLAEMVYHMADDQTMVIEHTDVDDTLRGKGIGKILLGELVEEARKKGIKVVPMCPFANVTFQKTKEWQDVLLKINLKPKTK